MDFIMDPKNKYDKRNGQNAGNKGSSTDGGESLGGQGQEDKAAVNEILIMAKAVTNWDDRTDTNPLKREIRRNKTFGAQGDKFLLQLIITQNPKLEEVQNSLWTERTNAPMKSFVGPKPLDFRGIGKQLLRWMLKDTELSKSFNRAPTGSWGGDRRFEKKPIHLAIEEDNRHFLACFLGICYDPYPLDLRPKLNAVLAETDEKSDDRNCVHQAIEYSIPFAPFLVAICPIKALKEKDRTGQTPMFIALKRSKKGVESIPEPPKSVQGASNAPLWDNIFSPLRIVEEIEKRKDESEEKLIQSILIATDKDGTSPFQVLLEICKKDESKEKPSEQEVLKKLENRQFLDRLKQLIFHNVDKISDVSTALYGNGTKSDVKELCLDMSDFNQSSHNFETFVDKLTRLDAKVPESEAVFKFEDTLFFVTLPDLNYVKQPCPHHATRRLFDWLRLKNVRKIKKLSIPDNTTDPLCEAFVQQHIIDGFDIEELDWRKLDVNLDVITGTQERRTLPEENMKRTSNTWECLKRLTLYSSGNWSALYHWISEDGLAKLPALKKVRINIVHLNQTDGFYDEATHNRHRELANEYKARLERMHASKDCFKYELEVKSDAIWDYPPPPHQPDEPTTRILKHQFTSQLLPSLNALGEWERGKINLNDGEYLDDEWNDLDSESGLDQMRARFQKFALEPQKRFDRIDRRIRVAIIDNGADRIRSKFRHMIAKGQSYVTADLLGSDRSLPWWMVSDPHGTQMASLIGQTNPYCRLYIARVGKGRTDINPTKAAEAIAWAVEQKVDIISISWTLKEEDEKLKNEIEKAARSTLIFCSTPDQGVYSEAWPVAYKDHVLSVSATDNFGHLTSKTKGTDLVDIQIPGENVSVAGPVYIGNMNDTVSGSSVATALAAGIASLALLLLRTFNPELGAGLNEGDREDMKEFYTKKGIMRIFRGMDSDTGALKLPKLFPDEKVNESKTLEVLAKNWNVANFPKLPQRH